jgi:hypothetical protein
MGTGLNFFLALKTVTDIEMLAGYARKEQTGSWSHAMDERSNTVGR